MNQRANLLSDNPQNSKTLSVHVRTSKKEKKENGAVIEGRRRGNGGREKCKKGDKLCIAHRTASQVFRIVHTQACSLRPRGAKKNESQKRLALWLIEGGRN